MIRALHSIDEVVRADEARARGGGDRQRRFRIVEQDLNADRHRTVRDERGRDTRHVRDRRGPGHDLVRMIFLVLHQHPVDTADLERV